VGGGIGGGTGPGSGGGGARGAYAPGVYRSNASLLAVIQKYSAGIQYCYGNELKRDPALRGKLVVALTVAASGEVLEATIVQDTVRSPRLAACTLSQIREWRFPAIPVGVTAFQAPFVFTPPN
jgi:outer membrane biosynthesis protein TonB